MTMLPTDHFFGAKHPPLQDRARKNDRRSWKYWEHRADKTNGEQHNREEPPEQFHLRES